MRALLAVCDVIVSRGPNHDALFSRTGILKQLHASDLHLTRARDSSGGVTRSLSKPAPDEDPQIACEHPETAERQEFCELPPVYIFLVGFRDREFLAPE